MVKHYHIIKKSKDEPFVVWRVRLFFFTYKVYWAPSIELCTAYIQKQCSPKERINVVVDIFEDSKNES